MKKIFLTRKLLPLLKELLSEYFEVYGNPENNVLSTDRLIEAVQNYDGILSTIPDKIDRVILSHAGPNLEVICNYATGLDNIDLAFAKEKGITVLNTPDAVTNATADHTFAVFLSFLRKVPEGQAFVRANKWKGWDPWLFLGEDLLDKTFGIVGYGRIGKAVAQRALGFGLRVIYYHYREVDSAMSTVRQVSWKEMLEQVDYLSLHVPVTKNTLGMIDYSTIKKMKKRPIIINMARGPVIKTNDLLRALKEDLLRGAVLDVTDPEPLSSDHPLCHLDKCLVVPHIGTSTIDCRKIMAIDTVNNFKKAFHI